MECNIGAQEKKIRMGVGIVLLILGLFVFKSVIVVFLGLIALVTGLLNFCPAYKLLGMNTCTTSEAGDVADSLESAADSVKDTASDSADKVTDVAGDAKDAVTDAAEGAVDKAKDVVDDVKDAVKK